MTTVRCYVPVGLEQLVGLREDRTLAGPLPAVAVTPAVRAANPSGDREEWEYAALQEAARRLVAEGGPVVVAAADLAEDSVRGADNRDDGQVEVGDVDLPRVAAFHLGDDVVTGNASSLPDPGVEVELSWYDTTELSHVLELVQTLAATPGERA